eukprot:5048005-Amphidinium_carterae.1
MATGIALGQNVNGEIDHTTPTSLEDQSSSSRKMRGIRNDKMFKKCVSIPVKAAPKMAFSRFNAPVPPVVPPVTGPVVP